MNKIERIISPGELLTDLPLPSRSREFIQKARTDIGNILNGSDSRLLLIVGPCSIHNMKSAVEYAKKLKELSKEVEDRFFILMRVYLEKPRTTLGWKGFIHDPFLNGSQDMTTGLRWARELLLELASMNVAAGMEFLELITPSYLGDLISWGSIGARTCCSQPHRQLASGLPMPLGFKNSLDGDPNSAVQAVFAAKFPQTCITIGSDGHAGVMKTSGNPLGHIVLRGANNHTNYDKDSIDKATSLLRDLDLTPHLIVDCSHGNCQKNHNAQEYVFESLIKQIICGNKHIVGLMLESHIKAGSQAHHADPSLLQDTISLTDPCISWSVTEKLIRWADKMIAEHAPAVSLSKEPLPCPS